MVDGDFKNLIKALEETPSTVARLLSRLSTSDLHHKESDEFSALENICHLRDLEIEGYGERIVRILQEDEPSLPDFDGVRIAWERNYNNQDSQAALDGFSGARRKNLELVRNLSQEQLGRKANLVGVGVISLKKLLEMMIEHDQSHVSDLTTISRRRRHSQTSGTAAI